MNTARLSLAVGALLATFSFATWAQSATSKASAPPPGLEKIEEPSEAITVSKPEARSKTAERRNNAGKVGEVQVKSGKSAYTLKANPEYGNTPKGTPQGDANRAAQWTILEFGGKKETHDAAPAQGLPPAPPPPQPAAPASASAQ